MSEKIEVVEHSNYRAITVSGAIGTSIKNNIQITIFSNDLNCNEYASDPNVQEGQIKLRRVIECKLLMDPSAARTLLNVVNSSIDNYEKAFGTIAEPVKTTDSNREKGTDVSTPYK